MKKIYYIVFITAFIIGSCTMPTAENTYTIDVVAEGIEGKNLKLQKRADGEWITIDSMQVIESQAVFTGILDNPEFFYLSVEGNRNVFGFFAEASPMNIRLHTENIRESELTGSETHDRYEHFIINYESFNDKLRAAYAEYQAAEMNQDKEGMDIAEASYTSTQIEQNQYLVDFVNNNSEDVVAHFALYRNSYMFELEELEGMVANFDPNKNSIYADELREKVEILRRVAVGQPFVDFEQEDPTGQLIALSDAVGSKLLLVDFWASWCGPCRRENPNIVAVYQDYKDKGFDVFGVSLDTDKDKWIEAIEEDELTWWHVSDLAGWGNNAGKKYGVQSIPHSVLIDENGIIIDKNLRDEELRSTIAALLD